jgi:hypothetical protein
MPNSCPVCLNKHSEPASITEANLQLRVDCPVCGRYALDRSLWGDELDPQTGAGYTLSERCRAALSHQLRTSSSNGTSGWPLLTRDRFIGFKDSGCIAPNPAAQVTNIIRYLGDEISNTGAKVESLPIGFYAQIGAPNPEFAAQLASELAEKGLITAIDASSNDGTDLIGIGLTLEGWERYEQEARGQIAGNYGFLALEFNDSVLDPLVDDVIKPIVRDATGYQIVDMRDVAQAGIIDNIMRAQIRDAAFVIVDLTHDNSGAYWEAGYAEGLGKPVIYICEKSKFDEKKTHFDTNHLTTVIWSESETEKFGKELIATIRRSLNLFPSAL